MKGKLRICSLPFIFFCISVYSKYKFKQKQNFASSKYHKATTIFLTFANLAIKEESFLVDCRLYLICIFNKGSAFTPRAASISSAIIAYCPVAIVQHDL